MTCSRGKMEKRSTLAAPRTSILHRERRALNFFRYGKYTAGRLDATFCFSFADSAAVCTYLTRSLSPKKYDWSRATPDETVRYTYWDSRFAHPLSTCDYTRASEYTYGYAFEKKKPERAWTVERCVWTTVCQPYLPCFSIVVDATCIPSIIFEYPR